MFSSAVNLAALIPLLLHSILGCCWHHTHRFVSDQAARHVVTLECSLATQHGIGDGHCGHQHDTAPEPLAHGEDGPECPEPCDEEPCEIPDRIPGPSSSPCPNSDCQSFCLPTENCPRPNPAFTSLLAALDMGPLTLNARCHCALLQVWQV
jgi:hypothetical protein